MQIHPGVLGLPRPSLDWQFLGVKIGRGQTTIFFDNLRRDFALYKFILDDCRPSGDGSILSFQVGNAGGMFAANYQYHLVESLSSAAAYASGNSASAGQIVLANAVGNAAGENYSGELNLHYPDWSFRPTALGLMRSHGAYITSLGAAAVADVHGNYNLQDAPYSRIGFTFSASTWVAGAIYQYALPRRSIVERLA